MEAYFNSRNLKYKKPFGAMKTESRAEIFIEAKGAQTAFLRLWFDEKETLVPMKKASGGFFASIKMPESPQLLWYHFIFEEDGKRYFYYSGGFAGEGVLKDAPEGDSFRITVYKKDFKTPDWFSGSVMYQIFPDRFFRTEKPQKKREEYVIHEDWYEPFKFRAHPFENGPACNDFYGGSLKGIEEKLPYLSDLGIGVIYLNPIFEAYSNHRYDTANYSKIDPMLGTEEDFKSLCAAAKKCGIRIILDGVFSHTGSDSIYFNKYKSYGEGGAYNDESSPYRAWYGISENGEYESWWGCTNLPNVKETEPTYLDYILRGNDAIIKKWLRLGASGWRLDVADELPDEFIKILRREAKSQKSDSVIIGEVWEDASDKVSYGELREYLLGDELDSVMNYPFKDSVIGFIMGEIGAEQFCDNIMRLAENYPKEVFKSLMNILGTHDTMRIKTVFGGQNIPENLTDAEKWRLSLDGAEETLALSRLRLAVFMQMTFPGVPCVYYGDEVGAEGISDPYNRKPFPWRKINPELLAYYKEMIAFRNENEFVRTGEFVPLYAKGGVFVYMRKTEGEFKASGGAAKNNAAVFAVNASSSCAEIVLENLPEMAEKLLKKEQKIIIEPMKARIFMGK